MQEQARRHETTNFLFLDLKLNSWPEMLRGIGRNIDRYVRGAEWLGTVHVDQRPDNGLSRKDLDAAVEIDGQRGSRVRKSPSMPVMYNATGAL